jgi:hypothetical protein
VLLVLLLSSVVAAAGVPGSGTWHGLRRMLEAPRPPAVASHAVASKIRKSGASKPEARPPPTTAAVQTEDNEKKKACHFILNGAARNSDLAGREGRP